MLTVCTMPAFSPVPTFTDKCPTFLVARRLLQAKYLTVFSLHAMMLAHVDHSFSSLVDFSVAIVVVVIFLWLEASQISGEKVNYCNHVAHASMLLYEILPF